MSAIVKCECGEAVEIPDGQLAVLCPQCNRHVVPPKKCRRGSRWLNLALVLVVIALVAGGYGRHRWQTRVEVLHWQFQQPPPSPLKRVVLSSNGKSPDEIFLAVTARVSWKPQVGMVGNAYLVLPDGRMIAARAIEIKEPATPAATERVITAEFDVSKRDLEGGETRFVYQGRMDTLKPP